LNGQREQTRIFLPTKYFNRQDDAVSNAVYGYKILYLSSILMIIEQY